MTSQPEPATDEGVLDPWVVEWVAANPERADAVRGAARPSCSSWPGARSASRRRARSRPSPTTSSTACPSGSTAARTPPTGLVVYFHGGGYVIGSIGLMDNVARELAHGSGAVVVSVEYRLAPEHPYPAGLDDCERVTRWAFANAERFGVSPQSVAVARRERGREPRRRGRAPAPGRGRRVARRPGAHLPAGVRDDDLPVGGGVRRSRHQPRGRCEVLGGVQRRARPRPAIRTRCR